MNNASDYGYSIDGQLPQHNETRTMTRDEVETALDRGMLQMQSVGHYSGGKWYDVRRNGATKTWKRDPNKVEIPCKIGFREAFRLAGNVNVDAVTYERNVWKWNYTVRVRPANFDPRKRD